MLRDSKLRFNRLSPMAHVMTIGAVLLFGVLVAGLRGPAGQPQALAEDVAEIPAATPAAGMILFAGFCHDDQGRPIADAKVFLYRVDSMESLTQQRLQTVQTKQEGKFRFAPVADATKDQDPWKRSVPQYAPYRIIAKASGRATASKCVPQPSIDPSHVHLHMPEGATLSGKVIGPDGKPVEGALVWGAVVLVPKPIPGIGSAVTDAAGRFEIRDLCKMDMTKPPAGVTSWQTGMPLHVRCPGFGEKRVEYSKVPGTVNVRLEPAAIVKGRVLLENHGAPVGGVRVQFQGIKEAAWGIAVTDAEGRYRFDSLGPDKYNIWASKDGFTMRAIDPFEAVPGTTKAVPDLRLVRGGFIVGHVVDADTGQPFYPSDAKAPPWFRPDVALYGPSRPRSGAACEATPIQADGWFCIRAAPGSNYVYLRIYKPSQAVPPAAMDVDVAEGQTVTIEFKVRQERTGNEPQKSPAGPKPTGAETKEPKTTKGAMRVHVVDQDGSPVAGTKVQAFASVKGHTTPIVWDYVCDANGQAVVALPQSVIRLYLVLSKDGYLTLSRDYGLLTAGHQPPQDSTIKLVKLSPDQAKAIAEIEEKQYGGIRAGESDQGLGMMVTMTEKTTDAGLELLRRLPPPDYLVLVTPNVTDAGLAQLEILHGLKKLTLGCAKITDAGLAHLESLQGLKELELFCPKITDAGLVHLQPLRVLENLTLGCAVTDAGMKHLTPLKELRTLVSYGVKADLTQKKLFDALQSPTDFEFFNVPLRDICEYIGDYHNIKVQIDEVVLKSGKFGRDIPLSCNVKAVQLGVGLDSLLEPVGLGWVVDKRTLTVTTKDTVRERHPGVIRLQQALPNLKLVIVDW